MIVDVHTRVWESSEQLGAAAERLRRRRNGPWDRPTASPEEHAQAMSPVATALVLGLESRLLGASIPIEKVAQYVSQSEGRSLGIAGIDPTAGQPVRVLERAVEAGLMGVTVSPAAQGFHPADSRAMALYEACEAKRVPLLVESGVNLARETMMEFAPPHLLDEPARTFPDLPIVLMGLGCPWIESGLALLDKHPTMYADLAALVLRPWQLYHALVLAHQHGLMERLLFGSDFPYCSPEKAIVTIYSVNTLVQGTHLPSVPREQLRTIVERDALERLGLPMPGKEANEADPEAGESASSAAVSISA